MSKGIDTFTIPVTDLGSNPYLFIHVGCYTAVYQQKGSIKIKEKNSPEELKVFPFGPVSTQPFNGYKDALDTTYPIKQDTSYEVEVEIDNDKGTGGRSWNPSTVRHVVSISAGNFHEYLVVSEDETTERADDINDTVVRLIWFSVPREEA